MLCPVNDYVKLYRFAILLDEEKSLNLLLNISSDLKQAYWFKEY